MSTDIVRLSLTAKIVAAYVTGNAVTNDEVIRLIPLVHRSLSGIGTPAMPEPPPPRPSPAVPIRQSITPDYIICLEDGRQLKTLRRHLANAYGLTPEAYRSRWGLGFDYPMVAPNYAATRSRLAKINNLGKGRRSSKQSQPQHRKTKV